MASDQLNTLKRVGNLTMGELLTVGRVPLGPGFAERVRAALDNGAAGGDEARQSGLVLVADADPDICDLLKLVFEDQGHEVIQASDGEGAVTMALERRPQLCVLDEGLGGLDGVRATRLLRAADQTSEVPIVLLSTGVRGHTLERAREAGVDAYLRKPFRPEELERSVAELLAG